jgi:hypothetical protein
MIAQTSAGVETMRSAIGLTMTLGMSFVVLVAITAVSIHAADAGSWSRTWDVLLAAAKKASELPLG